MSDHTPCPWFVRNVGRSQFVYALNKDGTDRFDLMIEGGYIMEASDKVGLNILTPNEELKANARLIAAAPEMLEAISDSIADLSFITKAIKEFERQRHDDFERCKDVFEDLSNFAKRRKSRQKEVIAAATGEEESE